MALPAPLPVPELPRRRRIRFAAETLAVVLGYVVTAVAGSLPADLRRLPFYGVGAVLVAVPVLLKQRREQRAEVAALAAGVDLRGELAVTLSDAVIPLAELVAAIGRAGTLERAVAHGRLVEAVVGTAARLCDGERARAVFFALDGDELAAGSWAGRGDAPSAVFVDAADARGTAAHELVRQGAALVVADTAAERLPDGVFVDADAPYRSFLAVGVTAGGIPFGMLTVDALEPDAITREDLAVARSLAILLAAGLAIGTRRPADG